jgi:aminoglycoside phosphotransferase family enzyme
MIYILSVKTIDKGCVSLVRSVIVFERAFKAPAKTVNQFHKTFIRNSHVARQSQAPQLQENVSVNLALYRYAGPFDNEMHVDIRFVIARKYRACNHTPDPVYPK